MCAIDWLFVWNGVATIRRLLNIIGLFCKRALYKGRYSAKETYDFEELIAQSVALFDIIRLWNRRGRVCVEGGGVKGERREACACVCVCVCVCVYSATHCNTLQHTATHC